VDDAQKKAIDFVGSLLKFYGDYRMQKEREAYAVTTVYLGATGALLAGTWEHPGAMSAAVGVVSLVVAALVRWQLGNLRFAARMVGACVNVSSQWLQQPPGAASLRTTPLCGHSVTVVPADVDTEFKKQKVTGVRVARFVVPSLIVAWGVVVAVILWY
jgi:hypothetical protein